MQQELSTNYKDEFEIKKLINHATNKHVYQIFDKKNNYKVSEMTHLMNGETTLVSDINKLSKTGMQLLITQINSMSTPGKYLEFEIPNDYKPNQILNMMKQVTPMFKIKDLELYLESTYKEDPENLLEIYQVLTKHLSNDEKKDLSDKLKTLNAEAHTQLDLEINNPNAKNNLVSKLQEINKNPDIKNNEVKNKAEKSDVNKKEDDTIILSPNYEEQDDDSTPELNSDNEVKKNSEENNNQKPNIAENSDKDDPAPDIEIDEAELKELEENITNTHHNKSPKQKLKEQINKNKKLLKQKNNIGFNNNQQHLQNQLARIRKNIAPTEKQSSNKSFPATKQECLIKLKELQEKQVTISEQIKENTDNGWDSNDEKKELKKIESRIKQLQSLRYNKNGKLIKAVNHQFAANSVAGRISKCKNLAAVLEICKEEDKKLEVNGKLPVGKHFRIPAKAAEALCKNNGFVVSLLRKGGNLAGACELVDKNLRKRTRNNQQLSDIKSAVRKIHALIKNMKRKSVSKPAIDNPKNDG